MYKMTSLVLLLLKPNLSTLAEHSLKTDST